MKAILSFGCVLMALAIIGTGTAFATTYTYNPATISNYDGNSPTFSQTSSEGKAVNDGDIIEWYNTLNNRCDHQVTGYVGALSWPAGGFENKEQSGTIGAWGSLSKKYSATIQDGSSHIILAYHGYYDLTTKTDSTVTYHDMSYT